MTRALAIRNTILAALRQALVSGSIMVYADLRQALGSGQRPAVIVEMGDESPPTAQYGNRERTLMISVRILADGADPYAEIDPLRIAVHATMMADKTVGGRCTTLTEGNSTRERVDLDVPIAGLMTLYKAHYTTTQDSLL
jgi:hypothetical protein